MLSRTHTVGDICSVSGDGRCCSHSSWDAHPLQTALASCTGQRRLTLPAPTASSQAGPAKVRRRKPLRNAFSPSVAGEPAPPSPSPSPSSPSPAAQGAPLLSAAGPCPSAHCSFLLGLRQLVLPGAASLASLAARLLLPSPRASGAAVATPRWAAAAAASEAAADAVSSCSIFDMRLPSRLLTSVSVAGSSGKNSRS